MCMSAPSMPNIPEQLNKGNATLSNEKVAQAAEEKKSTKRNISSLRVPMKSNDTSTVGVNTNETATGLNIPV